MLPFQGFSWHSLPYKMLKKEEQRDHLQVLRFDESWLWSLSLSPRATVLSTGSRAARAVGRLGRVPECQPPMFSFVGAPDGDFAHYHDISITEVGCKERNEHQERCGNGWSCV